MELLNKDITLGFYNDTGIVNLPVSQYDAGRIISIGFTNDGKRFEIPENTSVFLKAIKPDGKQVNTDEWCGIHDNKVVIEVSKQLSAAPGIVKCELILSDDTGKQYTSSRFNIVVSKTVHNDENLTSTDTYKNILDILLELNGLKKDLVFKKEKDQPGGVPSLDDQAKIPRHELYDADLNSKGVVKLVDSVQSDSTVDAATPNSVKNVNDTLAAHMTDTENPHHLTKEQLGLANVDNTSDADKPVSNAQKAVNDLIGAERDSVTKSTNIDYTYPDPEQDKCLNAVGISTLVQAVRDLSKKLSEAVLKVKRSIPTIKKNNTVLIPDAANAVNITVPTKVSELQNDSHFVSTDTNTWKANTKDSEGYIPAGKGHANQVWRTDADGNPGWRENSVGAALGFTPVQQGGGAGQGANKVKIGWSTNGTGLKTTVDSTDLGKVYTQNNCDIVIPVNRGGTGATTAANACANIGAVKKAGDTMTGTLNSSKATNSYLAGNQGQAIINSTAAAGAYTMLDKLNSTNGYFTDGVYNGNRELHYTPKTTVNAGTNAVAKTAVLLDEAGNTRFPGTITAPLFSGKATSAEKLATARSINGLLFDGTSDRANYGEGIVSNSVITVSCPGFKLVNGAVIRVLLKTSHIISSTSKLNVNNTGEVAIRPVGKKLHAAEVYTFVYDAGNKTFRCNGGDALYLQANVYLDAWDVAETQWVTLDSRGNYLVVGSGCSSNSTTCGTDDYFKVSMLTNKEYKDGSSIWQEITLGSSGSTARFSIAKVKDESGVTFKVPKGSYAAARLYRID